MTAAALKDLQPRTGTPIFVFKNQKDDFQILNTQVFKSAKRSISLNISTSSKLREEKDPSSMWGYLELTPKSPN